MGFQINLSCTTISAAVAVSALSTGLPGHAGEWVACALDPSTGAKAVVVGAHEISLETDVPFRAIPMRANPKLSLAPGHQSGRCYLNEQQRQAVLSR